VIFGPKAEGVIGEWGKLQSEDLRYLYSVTEYEMGRHGRSFEDILIFVYSENHTNPINTKCGVTDS
jgi:hypothetical protein